MFHVGTVKTFISKRITSILHSPFQLFYNYAHCTLKPDLHLCTHTRPDLLECWCALPVWPVRDMDKEMQVRCFWFSGSRLTIQFNLHYIPSLYAQLALEPFKETDLPIRHQPGEPVSDELPPQPSGYCQKETIPNAILSSPSTPPNPNHQSKGF